MDIFSLNELLLVAFVALLVIGPERLPETLRTLGLWIGRLTRSFNSVKAELEKEIGMDEIRRQLHNESVMAEMKRIEQEVKNSAPPPLEDTPGSPESDPVAEKDIAPPPEPDLTLATPPASTDDAPAVENLPGEENTIHPPVTQTAPEDTPIETPPIKPRSEAELEALHASRLKRAKANKADQS